MLDLEAGLGNLHRNLGAPSNVVGEARLQLGVLRQHLLRRFEHQVDPALFLIRRKLASVAASVSGLPPAAPALTKAVHSVRSSRSTPPSPRHRRDRILERHGDTRGMCKAMSTPTEAWTSCRDPDPRRLPESAGIEDTHSTPLAFDDRLLLHLPEQLVDGLTRERKHHAEPLLRDAHAV